MVYAKARAYSGEWHEAGLRAFREQTGYAPRVLVTRTAVLGVGRTAKAARLALELALDGARVRQLAEAFGGVQYMSEPARRFIESWEVESYREQQALK
jgi:rhamnose utilization protein RhaD (predicted bifunctional aldolase and dehydrogenase)